MSTKLDLKWIRGALHDAQLIVEDRSGDLAGKAGNLKLTGVETDTRRVQAGNAFIAIRGESFDGHSFAARAAEAGAACVIGERPMETDLPQIIVSSSRLAYGAIAHKWRRRFGTKIAAVGGSNGKTTTAQMLRSILEAHWGKDHVIATEKNFNNDIGVPMTLLRLGRSTKAAVVEAGMNHRGEMGQLAGWIKPDVVLLTNAQREHQAHLETVAETAYENGTLIAALPDSGIAVFPADDPCAEIWRSIARARGVDTFTYSTKENVLAEIRGGFTPQGLRIHCPAFDMNLPFSVKGEHNAHNAVGAAAAAIAMGVELESIFEGLANFSALPGRGERWESPLGFTVIDDAYNCNPDSAQASLRALAAEAGERIFIFGDMGELGANAERWHAEVGKAAAELGIDRFWTAGPLARLAAEAYSQDGGAGGRAFETREDLIAHLSELPLQAHAVITVKASHAAGFERIVQALKAMKA